MDETIKYKSKHRFKGVLYDWHNDPYCGEHYQMSISDDKGKEILHSYNAKPTTLEELRGVVLNCQREVEHARHEEKERERGWKQKKIMLLKDESERVKAFKKEHIKYVVQHRTGDTWKTIFPNGVPLCFDTVSDAKEYMAKLKTTHTGIRFRVKKEMI